MKHIVPITYDLYDDKRKECSGPMCRHVNCKCTVGKVFITPFTLIVDLFYSIPYNINRGIVYQKQRRSKTVTRKTTRNSKDVCQICWQQQTKIDPIIQIKCCQVLYFHEKCIQQWNEKKQQCPFCRQFQQIQ